ncbi:MAG: hypothetical protein WBP81_30980, partial [Solirubrobacteraceae bacterium]
ARSTYAASLDVVSGELTRQRFDTGAVQPVIGWLAGLHGPVRAYYEAGPTGFGLYRVMRLSSFPKSAVLLRHLVACATML